MISIIVPVYKVEQYLPKCVDSIINQTYKDIEIILVDDGSPDNCPAICDDYARKDIRVKAIHKTNGGVSDARNVGIDNAKGEYIFFVDGDDWLEKQALSECLEIIRKEKSDAVVTKSYNMVSAKESICIGEAKENLFYSLDSERALIEILTEHTKLSPWGNLYEKKLFNKIRFIKGYIYEDLDFIPRLFLEAKKITLFNGNIYNYLLRKGSIMHHETTIFTEQLSEIVAMNIDLFRKKVTDKEINNKLTTSMIFLLILWYEESVLFGFKNKENSSFRKSSRIMFEKYLTFIINNKEILIKRKIHYILTALMPEFILISLLKIVYKGRN